MTAEEELGRLERQVLGLARVRRFTDAVALIERMIARGDDDVVARILDVAAPMVARDLATALVTAFEAGIADASRLVNGAERLTLPEGPGGELTLAARETQRKIAEAVQKAHALMAGGADPATALAPLQGARAQLQRDVRSLVNQSGNRGSRAVADAAEVPLVWIAEVNACVECVAYSGKVADPGESFPGGLTFGARPPRSSAPVAEPPLHPNCRCTLEPLNDPSYAEALEREAKRQVLRGFSLESEPMATRIEAARKLLESGFDDAPKSVLAFARRAVKAGTFPTRGRPSE